MRTEEIPEMDDQELEKLTKEMMIMTGMELGAYSLIHGNFFRAVTVRYCESSDFPMLENEGEVKQANELCFLNKPKPLSHPWSH